MLTDANRGCKNIKKSLMTLLSFLFSYLLIPLFMPQIFKKYVIHTRQHARQSKPREKT